MLSQIVTVNRANKLEDLNRKNWEGFLWQCTNSLKMIFIPSFLIFTQIHNLIKVPIDQCFDEFPMLYSLILRTLRQDE